MDPAAKTRYLQLIADEQLTEALAEMTAAFPTVSRLQQLQKRHRELEERMVLGTLNKVDVARVRNRITGGLRDVVRELSDKPATSQASTEPAKPTFKLNLTEETPPAPAATDWKAKGYFGDLDYQGSPTKQERTVTLHKSYGASYHTAREAIRKAGMEMVRGDRDGGILEAQIAPTGTGGYGEKILLWVTPLNAGTTRVHAVVDSQLPTLAMDFGRNKTKLGLLASYLR